MPSSRCVRVHLNRWAQEKRRDSPQGRAHILSVLSGCPCVVHPRERICVLMGITALVGKPIKRREDPRLITGQATYVDDIKLPGMLHMAVLRSQFGHARLKSINT